MYRRSSILGPWFLSLFVCFFYCLIVFGDFVSKYCLDFTSGRWRERERERIALLTNSFLYISFHLRSGVSEQLWLLYSVFLGRRCKTLLFFTRLMYGSTRASVINTDRGTSLLYAKPECAYCCSDQTIFFYRGCLWKPSCSPSQSFSTRGAFGPTCIGIHFRRQNKGQCPRKSLQFQFDDIIFKSN